MSIPAAQEPLLEQVLRAVTQIRPGPAPQPEDTLTGLGLDSLDRLTLAVAIEQATGLVVTDQVLSGAATPAGLASRLLASMTGALS